MTACAIFAMRGECLRNPDHMFTSCPASCGVCTNVCEDKNVDCQLWATQGECDKNPVSMNKACPQSCGLCQQLELFYRYGISGNKDEL